MNKIAVVFPGQGSQSLGMLAEIAKEFKEVKETFNQASQVLGYDLWRLTQEGPLSELDQTTHTQPAILAASYAIWRILEARKPLAPVVCAGHSLGEYTALVCAKALTYTDAIQLVAARGLYMQEAVAGEAVAMAAIVGLTPDGVAEVCRESAKDNEVLSPANFNSIGQIVISGHKAAIERALILAKQKGAKMAVLIPVSVASHCSLMLPAAEKLEKLLADTPFQLPQIPVINNVDIKQYDSIDMICDGLTRQLYKPVRWVETIQAFVKMGVSEVIECGPGQVLTGLGKRIDKSLQFHTTNELAQLKVFL